MAKEVINKNLGKGIYTIPSDPELIPQQASQDSSGWISTDGQIELCRGRLLIGAEETANGFVKGEGWGFTVTGIKVHFRKINTKIQYYNTTTLLWTNIVTGLTDSAEYTFSPYQSLAGTFMYATGLDGIFKIHTANPGSYTAMYDSGKNYKGLSMIVQSRMSMWNVKGALTTHYMSYTDSAQDSTVYTSVVAEAFASLGDTLDKKSPTFTVTIASPAVFTSIAHGFNAGSSVVFSTTGALPTGLVAGTTYYVISAGLTADAFQVSLTDGGTAVNTSGSQSGTHSIVDSRRTFFNVRPTITGSGEVYTDNYDGTLTGSLGGTGTINYTTGVFTLSNAGAGTVNYSWEMTNAKGVTDFTFSATRTALQGDVVRQDEGGDAILNIVYHEGAYYSVKSKSVYRLIIASTGLSFENIVFRKDIGLPYFRALVVTGRGIVFMDTSNASKPQLTILQPNLTGDNLEPFTLARHFNFANYVWDACAMGTFGEYIVFSGRTDISDLNNKLFLYNLRRDTLDIIPYGAKTITTSDGLLYIGDVLTDNVYSILDGFDDDGDAIINHWFSNDERYGTDYLKKVKRLRFKGLITPDQILEIYISYDGDGPTLVGTILGSGTYVDFSTNYTIGSQGIGASVIGGEADVVVGNTYLAEIKLSGTKFRKRKIKLIATGVGYISINMMNDFNIRVFQQKLPARYRTKQNVSLDGTQTNL